MRQNTRNLTALSAGFLVPGLIALTAAHAPGEGHQLARYLTNIGGYTATTLGSLGLGTFGFKGLSELALDSRLGCNVSENTKKAVSYSVAGIGAGITINLLSNLLGDHQTAKNLVEGLGNLTTYGSLAATLGTGTYAGIEKLLNRLPRRTP